MGNMLMGNVDRKQKTQLFSWVSVRAKGLEPPRLSALDPKSSAATNYATPAGPYWDCKGSDIFYKCKFYLQKEQFFYSLYKIILAQLSISLVATNLNPFSAAQFSRTGISSV